jgi:D-sedoheptulose 7-phosphate isomerase
MTSFRLAERATLLASVIGDSVFTDGAATRLDPDPALAGLCATLLAARSGGNRVYVIGNGGSAAVAAHIVNDYVNVGKLAALTLHDPALLTCMANDYGYEHAYARLVRTMARPGDVVIGISSSGRSANIRNAATAAAEAGALAVTLSGFAPDNPLRSLGALNVWTPSEDYGLVETAHLFILHHVATLMAAAAAGVR